MTNVAGVGEAVIPAWPYLFWFTEVITVIMPDNKKRTNI